MLRVLLGLAASLLTCGGCAKTCAETGGSGSFGDATGKAPSTAADSSEDAEYDEDCDAGARPGTGAPAAAAPAASEPARAELAAQQLRQQWMKLEGLPGSVWPSCVTVWPVVPRQRVAPLEADRRPLTCALAVQLKCP